MKQVCLSGVLVAGVGLFLPSGVAAAQLPPRAVVHTDTLASFQGESAPLRVIFYQVRAHGPADEAGVGVTVLQPDGSEIVRAWDDQARLGLYEGTGVYDVSGDGWPEVVMIGWAGAKTFSASVYRLQNRKLQQIFHIEGFRVKVVNLRGQPVVVRGSWAGLSNLYVWKDREKDREFVDANEQFPEFFAPEIAEQRRILESPQGAPAYVIVDACFLGARALVYGKNYDQAEELCLKALQVAHSSVGLIPTEIGASPEKLGEERKQAEARIKAILDQISRARTEKLSRLPD